MKEKQTFFEDNKFERKEWVNGRFRRRKENNTRFFKMEIKGFIKKNKGGKLIFKTTLGSIGLLL